MSINLNGMVGEYLDNRRELGNESTFGAYLSNNLPRTRSQRADNWMKTNDTIPMQESRSRTWAGGSLYSLQGTLTTCSPRSASGLRQNGLFFWIYSWGFL